MGNFDGSVVALIDYLFLLIIYNGDSHEMLNILDDLAILKLDQGGLVGEKEGHKDIGIPHKDDDAFVDVDLRMDRKLEVGTYTQEN